MIRVTLSRLAFLGALVVATSGVVSGEEPPTGEAIFVRALSTWAAQPTPAFLSYRVDARLVRKGNTREERENVILRTADRMAIVETLAVDARGKERVTHVEFGRPKFDPDVTFGLVPRTRAAPEDSVEPQADSRTIGHVVARAKRYAIQLVGQKTLRGHDVYDLHLTPTDDARSNSVREMLVDTRTFVTWRVVDEAPYTIGLAHGTFDLEADYAPVGSSWLLSEVTTSGAMRFGPFSYGGDGDVRYAIVDASATVPAYCFSRRGFQSHTECTASIPH